jgi:hypothetical protein
MDLAIYKAKCRVDNSTLLLPPIGADEMKRRRGFNQQADMRQLKNTK